MRLSLLKYLEEAGKNYPDQAEFIGRLKKEMDKPVQVYSSRVPPDVRANGATVVKPMVADFYMVLKIDTPDQLKKAEKGLGEGIPGKIGDPNDTRLRQLHRAVMVWRSMATMEMARNPGPGAVEIAKEVRKRTEATLRNPVGHEQVTVW